MGSASPTGADASEMDRACSSGLKALRHHAPRNWHSGAGALFTMSRDRTEGGGMPECAERSQFWKTTFKTQSQAGVEISVKAGVDRRFDNVKNEANQAENEAKCGGLQPPLMDGGTVLTHRRLGRHLCRVPGKTPVCCANAPVRRPAPPLEVAPSPRRGEEYNGSFTPFERSDTLADGTLSRPAGAIPRRRCDAASTSHELTSLGPLD